MIAMLVIVVAKEEYKARELKTMARNNARQSLLFLGNITKAGMKHQYADGILVGKRKRAAYIKFSNTVSCGSHGVVSCRT